MAERLVLDLFCEDFGHEAFASALVRRLAEEEGLPNPAVRARSARGGHGQAVTELKGWQRLVRRLEQTTGDLLMVVVDANAVGWAERRRGIDAALESGLHPAIVVGCPDPHVEAWCAADPDALRRVLGVGSLSTPPRGGGRAGYKQWLREALEAAGHVVLADPMGVAWDLVPAIDLYAAGKRSPSLGHFAEELRTALRRARQEKRR